MANIVLYRKYRPVAHSTLKCLVRSLKPLGFNISATGKNPSLPTPLFGQYFPDVLCVYNKEVDIYK